VYDGLSDEIYLAMLAGVAMTGQGEALGMLVDDGRWHIAPVNVRLQGGGWDGGWVPVDGFRLTSQNESQTVLRNESFELTFFRRLASGQREPMTLTAHWADHDPVVLAQVRSL